MNLGRAVKSNLLVLGAPVRSALNVRSVGFTVNHELGSERNDLVFDLDITVSIKRTHHVKDSYGNGIENFPGCLNCDIACRHYLGNLRFPTDMTITVLREYGSLLIHSRLIEVAMNNSVKGFVADVSNRIRVSIVVDLVNVLLKCGGNLIVYGESRCKADCIFLEQIIVQIQLDERHCLEGFGILGVGNAVNVHHLVDDSNVRLYSLKLHADGNVFIRHNRRKRIDAYVLAVLQHAVSLEFPTGIHIDIIQYGIGNRCTVHEKLTVVVVFLIVQIIMIAITKAISNVVKIKCGRTVGRDSESSTLSQGESCMVIFIQNVCIACNLRIGATCKILGIEKLIVTFKIHHIVIYLIGRICCLYVICREVEVSAGNSLAYPFFVFAPALEHVARYVRICRRLRHRSTVRNLIRHGCAVLLSRVEFYNVYLSCVVEI